MTNPLRGWYSDLFGSRGTDVASALNYVDQLATASSDAVAVQTAARVLLNTAINAMDQILNSRSPEKLALIELIDERIEKLGIIREDAVADKITDWMSDHLESYIDDNVNLEDKISNWMSDNFDVNDYNLDDVVNEKINEWMDNTLADKIQDLDLVVRLR